MAEKKDGGPAFPVGRVFDPRGNLVQAGASGMSLRDWFAGTAPPMTDTWLEDSLGEGDHYLDAQAAWNYAYADAMLAAREKPDA